MAVSLATLVAAIVYVFARDDVHVATVVLSLVFVCLATLGAWGLGAYLFTRRAYLAQLEERAELAERERDQLARLHTVEECAAVARELHDVVAHTVSVMTVQAAAARVALHNRPETAEAAIRGVEAAGRRSMDELGRLVRLLRGAGRAPERTPPRGLADLPALVDEFRAAGLPVRYVADATPPDVEASAGLAGFRIVQEALTNALKHAGAREVVVGLRPAPQGVELEVADDGRGGAGDGSAGHGLIGMRERAALVGAQLEAGPRPGGGFRSASCCPPSPRWPRGSCSPTTRR